MSWVATLIAVIWTCGITPPEGSVAVPRMSAVLFCARQTEESKNSPIAHLNRRETALRHNGSKLLRSRPLHGIIMSSKISTARFRDSGLTIDCRHRYRDVDVPVLQRLDLKGHESSDDHHRATRSAASPSEHHTH